MTRHGVRLALGITTILSIGIAVRLGPLWVSPLPFNPDGIVYAGLVEATRTTGTLPLGQMAVDSLAFTAFLTALAEVTGTPALFIAQPAIAIAGTVPALVGAVIAVRFARRRGWSPGHRTKAALLAGGLLGIEGLFLHRTMAVDEQTLGIVLVPLVMLAVVLARSDHRWTWVAAPIVLVLPVLHNLDTVVLVLGLAMLVGLRLADYPGRTPAPALAVLIAVTAYATAITLALARWTPLAIIQSGRLTSVPGLLLAWVIAIAGLLPWLRTTRARMQRLTLTALFAVLLGLVAVNAVRPIFPGLPATPPRLLAGLAPLLVLTTLAAWEWPLMARDRQIGAAILALVGGPLVLGGLSLTASLTPEYLNTAYRASTFVHVPVVALASLGLIRLLGARSLAGHTLRSGAIVGVVLLAAAASIPVAFAGLELLPYKGVTTPAELSVAGFAVSHADGSWTADDHLGRIARYYSPNREFRTDRQARIEPVLTWLGGGPPPTCLTVAQHSWTTTGAQLFPLSPRAIATSTYEDWLRTSNVVYANTAPDPLVVVAPEPASGC